MSGCYRRTPTAVGALTAIALLLLSLPSFGQTIETEPVASLQATESRAEQREEEVLSAQRSMAKAGIAMAIIASIQVVFTSLGIIFVFRTLRATRAAVEASEASVGIAARSLSAARDMVNDARQNAERGSRAYVGVSTALLKGFAAGKPRIEIGFTNHGQTPAYKVRRISGLTISDDNEEFPLEEVGPEKTEPTINPGATIYIQHVIATERWTEEIQQQIRLETKMLFAFGVMNYEDAFGETRATSFRLVLDVHFGIGDETSLGTCPEGNDQS